MSERSAPSSDPDLLLSSNSAANVPATQGIKNNGPRTTDHGHSLTRELAEFIAFGFSLAILLCGFIVQPYFVPTASMATVLLGLHKDLHCDECGMQFPVGVDEQGLANTDRVRCPR